jgi:hypothetical protein
MYTYIYIHKGREEEVFKEFLCKMIKAEKFQEFHSASWGPIRADAHPYS